MKFNSAIASTISALAISTALGISASPAFSADFTLGNSSGTWSNPVGGANIDLNLPNGAENQVRWGGTTGAKSGLGFTGVGVTAFDVGDIFKVGTLRHFNNPIPSGTAATAVDLGITLNFTTPAIAQAFNFNLAIDETPNAPPCSYPSTTPCADKITFPNSLAPQSFNFMGMDFTLELIGFGDTPNGPFVSDFISQEGGTNSTMLYGKITKVNVPEPATLGALGMLGLYLVARRRSKKE